MNNSGNLGMLAGIFLLVFILIGAVSASVLTTNSEEMSEEEIDVLVNEVVDELCSLLQIKHIIAKYDLRQGEYTIDKIGILFKSFVSHNIDISRMTIELCDGQHYHMLFYNGSAESIQSYSFFAHPLWDALDPGYFGLLTTIDEDNSITNFGIMNKHTDMAFIILSLPDDFILKNGNQLDLTIQPSPGIGRTVCLDVPLPIKKIVTLYP